MTRGIGVFTGLLLAGIYCVATAQDRVAEMKPNQKTVQAGQSIKFEVTLDKAPNVAASVCLHADPTVENPFGLWSENCGGAIAPGSKSYTTTLGIPDGGPNGKWKVDNAYVRFQSQGGANSRNLQFNTVEFEVVGAKAIELPDRATIEIAK
jgi:hypothetical protein